MSNASASPFELDDTLSESTSSSESIVSSNEGRSVRHLSVAETSYIARIRQTESTQAYVSPYTRYRETSTSQMPRPAYSTTSPRSTHVTASSSTTPAVVNAGKPASVQATENERGLLAKKQMLITSLNEHRFNTVRDLRNAERILATIDSSDTTQPMTAAWIYYVNSRSLLTELRAITRNYPFSSACLDEAQRRVHLDPASNRSWNYCWLILHKIHTDGLISTSAQIQASQPEMWGGILPEAAKIRRLQAAFEEEWGRAVAQMLRYWDSPPTR